MRKFYVNKPVWRSIFKNDWLFSHRKRLNWFWGRYFEICKKIAVFWRYFIDCSKIYFNREKILSKRFFIYFYTLMKIVPMRLLTLLAFIIIPMATCLAAPSDPPPPTPPPPPGLPVDGGILILLAISVCYGIYKVYKFNFNKKAQH